MVEAKKEQSKEIKTIVSTSTGGKSLTVVESSEVKANRDVNSAASSKSSVKRSKSLTRMLSGSLKRHFSANKNGRKSKNEGALTIVKLSDGTAVETVDGGDCSGDKVVDNIVANLTQGDNAGALVRHTEHHYNGENADVEVDELDILQLSGSSWNKSSKGEHF